MEKSFEEALAELDRDMKEALREKGAIDCIPGDNYVAYLKHDGEDAFCAEVWSWGARHPDVGAGTREEIERELHSKYDAREVSDAGLQR